MRPINRIIIHCSDTPDDRDVTAADIDQWHRQRGFTSIGYHAVVRRDGTVEVGRPESEIGAHVKNHNADSLGVCLIGRNQYTHSQMLALFTLVRTWMRNYKIPHTNVLGHYELDSAKTCPNLKLDLVRKAIY